LSREKVRKILNIFKRATKRRKKGLEKLKTPKTRARFIVKSLGRIGASQKKTVLNTSDKNYECPNLKTQ